MTTEEIEQRIRQIMREQLSIKQDDELGIDADFNSDWGLDSLDQVEFIMALEEHFEIEITDEDSRDIHSLKDVIGFIEKSTSS